MKKDLNSKTLQTIVGYGTFITQKRWINYINVEVCLIKKFRRILPSGNWFPYVLPDDNSQFWGLKFDVKKSQLKQLDEFEGLDKGFFFRKNIIVKLRDNSELKADIYVPTEKTIKLQNLSLALDTKDRWKLEIKKHLDIIAQFPELII